MKNSFRSFGVLSVLIYPVQEKADLVSCLFHALQLYLQQLSGGLQYGATCGSLVPLQWLFETLTKTRMKVFSFLYPQQKTQVLAVFS